VQEEGGISLCGVIRRERCFYGQQPSGCGIVGG
jgi:hypothetical protein